MLVVNCSRPGLRQSEKLPRLIEYFSELGFATRMVYLDDLTPEHVRGVSGVVLGGSPLYLTEEPELVEKARFLKDVDIPIFGICFGHQLLGAIHGAQVGDFGETFKGPRTVTLTQEEYLLDCYGTREVVFDQEHRQHITLPQGFRLLATSQTCKVEAMRHETKPFFGVQFHPERYEETMKPLFERFASLCEEHKLYSAR